MHNEDCSEKTFRNYDSMMASFSRSVGDIPIELVSLDHIIIWKRYMQQKGNKPSSINSDLGRFRKMLRYLEDAGLGVMSPSKIKFNKRKPEERTWLEPDEMQALIKHAPNDRDRAIIALLVATGCRISEILNLDRSDIENATYADDGLYEIWVKGKGDRRNQEKHRVAYFPPSVMAYLETYLEDRTDRFKPLFLSGQNSRITVSRVEQIVHDVTNRAGLDKRVTPHTLRHSRISDLLNNGAPMQDVQNLAGHSSVSTTVNIYGHVNEKHKREVFTKYSTPVL